MRGAAARERIWSRSVRATGTSSSGSSLSDTLMVSPIPWGEQSAYAHGRFDTPVLAVAGFGHTDVKRIAQALSLHGF